MRDHEADFSFLGNLMADIMKEVYEAPLASEWSHYITLWRHCFSHFKIFHCQFKEFFKLQIHLLVNWYRWIVEQYWITYLLARYVLFKCPRKPQQRSNLKLAQMSAGQISANISFSIHDVLVRSYWLLIQVIINEMYIFYVLNRNILSAFCHLIVVKWR